MGETIRGLRRRWPHIEGPATDDDICYASQNRQNAVKALAQRCDLILIVGSRNSSNSNRMVEVARDAGARSYLVPDADQFDPTVLDGARCVGVSSGASAPDHLVQGLLERLAQHGRTDVDVERVAEEDVVFALPARMAGAAR